MASLIRRVRDRSAPYGSFPRLSFVAVRAAGAVLAASWVIAAMWMASLIRRVPRSDRRRAFRFPDDTWTGAVPVQAAK